MKHIETPRSAIILIKFQTNQQIGTRWLMSTASMSSYMFRFPKVGKRISKCLKDFTDDNSFPLLSINVTPNKSISGFVQFTSKITEKASKFRSRNSFIIARSALSSLLKENTYELRTVSKGVSQVSIFDSIIWL